ncbi:hypothetical protein ACQ4PT_018942 [Festuca glaucescens]
MPFAGTVTSTLFLLIFLWAEGQPVKGLMPKTGSVLIVGNNLTATDAALMCYPNSVVDREVRLAKTFISKAPLAARFDAATVLLNGAGTAPSPPMAAERRAPPPMPGDRLASAAVAPPEDKLGLSWRAKAWCGWVLAVTLVIAVFVVRDQQPPNRIVTRPSNDSDPLWIPTLEWVDRPRILERGIDPVSGYYGPDLIGATDSKLPRVRRPETFLVSPPIDSKITDGDEPIKADIGEHLYCAICMEMVPGTLKFTVGPCGHAFCSSCVAQYVAAKLGENLARVECPDTGCGGVGAVDPDSCRGIISPDLLDKWGLLLCESALGAKKVYCPYKECSAPLLADDQAGAAAIAEAECPHCHRLFCARCAAPWHADIGCREFQLLGQDERGREDLLLRQLAGRQRWQRCPKCQMYVEKSEGCNYIKCRCGYSFCYRCASKVSAETHYCKKCKR